MLKPPAYVVSYSPAALRARAAAAARETANVRDRMRSAFASQRKVKLAACPECGRAVAEDLELAA